MLYLTHFITGLVIEFAALMLYLEKDRSDFMDLGTAVLALNLVTHPVLIYLIPMIQVNYVLSLVASELLVMVVEGILLAALFIGISRKRALKASVIANLSSWQFAPFLIYGIVTLKGVIG